LVVVTCDQSDSQNNSDEGDEPNENAAILDGVEDEIEGTVIIDLTTLDWSEAPIVPPDPGVACNGSPIGLDNLRPVFHPPSRSFVGPQIPNCSELTPGQLFFHFFKPEVTQQFLDSTNNYAKVVDICGWKDVDLEELKKFFAVLMVFGISCPPDRRMAWESNMFRIPVVCALMGRNRFEQIMRAWHYVDTSEITAAETVVRNAADPFWRVTPLVDQNSEVCQPSYHCAQSLSIDEQCIPFSSS